MDGMASLPAQAQALDVTARIRGHAQVPPRPGHTAGVSQ